MRVEILGEERRRRWSDDQKLDIVLSVGIEGATVTDVAQRHDVTRQQIYKWRRELRRKKLLLPLGSPVFLPVNMEMPEAQSPSGGEGSSSTVELRLCCGRSLCFDKHIDTAILARLIRAVEAA